MTKPATIIPFPLDRVRPTTPSASAQPAEVMELRPTTPVDRIMAGFRAAIEACAMRLPTPTPTPTPTLTPYTSPPAKVGSKYDRSMDITDIAIAVRRDIKQAQRDGSLMPGRVSVRSERYSGGQSLNVNFYIKPSSFMLMDSPSRQALHAKLTAIVEAYQRDAFDLMVDYFDVNFYEHIAIHADNAK